MLVWRGKYYDDDYTKGVQFCRALMITNWWLVPAAWADYDLFEVYFSVFFFFWRILFDGIHSWGTGNGTNGGEAFCVDILLLLFVQRLEHSSRQACRLANSWSGNAVDDSKRLIWCNDNIWSLYICCCDGRVYMWRWYIRRCTLLWLALDVELFVLQDEYCEEFEGHGSRNFILFLSGIHMPNYRHSELIAFFFSWIHSQNVFGNPVEGIGVLMEVQSRADSGSERGIRGSKAIRQRKARVGLIGVGALRTVQ